MMEKVDEGELAEAQQRLDQLYPEHAKMRRIMHLSQAIGEFLDWADARDWQLAQWNDDEQSYVPVLFSTEKLLAEHFGIDLEKVEKEKRAMLEAIRAELNQ